MCSIPELLEMSSFDAIDCKKLSSETPGPPYRPAWGRQGEVIYNEKELNEELVTSDQ